MRLIPGDNPAAFNLSFMHFVGNIIDIFELDLVRDKLIQFQIVRHGHLRKIGNVNVCGYHAINLSQN